jgi:hypothetical protein
MKKGEEMIINLKHKDTEVIKSVPLGFSWTTLLFGALVPLLRGDLKWFFISILIAFFTFGLGWFIIPFFYNKIYIKNLMEKGYVPADDFSKQTLAAKGLIAVND